VHGPGVGGRDLGVRRGTSQQAALVPSRGYTGRQAVRGTDPGAPNDVGGILSAPCAAAREGFSPPVCGPLLREQWHTARSPTAGTGRRGASRHPRAFVFHRVRAAVLAAARTVPIGASSSAEALPALFTHKSARRSARGEILSDQGDGDEGNGEQGTRQGAQEEGRSGHVRLIDFHLPTAVQLAEQDSSGLRTRPTPLRRAMFAPRSGTHGSAERDALAPLNVVAFRRQTAPPGAARSVTKIGSFQVIAGAS